MMGFLQMVGEYAIGGIFLFVVYGAYTYASEAWGKHKQAKREDWE